MQFLKRGQQQLKPNSVQRTQRHVFSAREVRESWIRDRWEKPRSFDDATDNCRLSKFTFLGYAGAADARLKQATIESEVLQESAIMDSVLAARDQQVSAQLQYMLVSLLEGSAQRLLEHAGDGAGLFSKHRLVAECDLTTAGRKTSLLLEVLAQTFKGNVRGSLDEFEMKIRKYGRSCKEVLSDRVKIAVVQMGLQDSDLKRHLRARRSAHNASPCARGGQEHHYCLRHADRLSTDGAAGPAGSSHER